MSYILAPSVLSADFGNLSRDIQMINESKADWFHVDVMDGVFVPNISFGFPVMKILKQQAKKPLDVHLMIVNPQHYFEEFKNAGADHISFHIEASTHLHRQVMAIKDLGIKAGVAINPHTSITQLEDTIQDIDIVLLMSVNPGFGGQSFIENTYSKLSRLKDLIIQKNSKALIEIDGGASSKNAAKLVQTGADILVAGNAVFSAPDPKKEIEILKSI